MQGSRYSAKEVGTALALVQAGAKTKEAAQHVGADPATVRRWVQRMRELNPEEWVPENVVSIHMATDLIQDGMQAIKQDGDAKSHLIALNAIRGTAIDKMQRTGSDGAQVAVRIRHADGTVTEIGARA